MLRSQQHRGPDAAGIAAWSPERRWTAHFASDAAGLPPELPVSGAVLGHNWLAIIDPRPWARQPMFSGTDALVFNGEVYNYIELREQLETLGCRFTTASDTEVLLSWWRRFGIEGVAELRGMFALAVYDPQAGRLCLVRDPCGIKPLYWARINGGLLFSSEMRALHAAGIPRRLCDTAAIAAAAAGINKFGETATLYEQVNELPPGHWLEARAGEIDVRRYAEMPELTADLAGEAAAAALRDELERSVTLHLRSSRRVASCVSGGLDSTSVATIIGLNRRLAREDFCAYTISSGGEEDREIELAREVCGKAGLDHRVFEYEGEIPARDVLEMVIAYETPNHVIGPINQFLLLRSIAEDGVTVVLDGQGGDELLSAYPWFVPVLLGAIERSGTNVEPLRRLLDEKLPFPPERMEMFGRMFHDARSWVRTFIWDTDFLGIRHEEVDALEETRYYLCGGGDWRRFRRRTYLQGELQYVLRQEDRLGMWFGLESRVPYVDLPLLRVAARLEPAFLLGEGYLKYPLRLAMPELPGSVRWNTRKRGYWDTSADRFPWLPALARAGCLPSPLLRRLFPKLEDNWGRMSFDQQWRLLQLAILERCASRGDVDPFLADAGFKNAQRRPS
jgi:asparagine synthase (glutamine-hydrolysing)